MESKRGPSVAETSPLRGPYRLGEVLGHGGMGLVYSAVHCETGERVAVKTVNALSHKALSALRAEVIALKKIRHPGIVRILAEGLAEAVPWYAMELLHGSTVKDFNEQLWHGTRRRARSVSGSTLTRTEVRGAVVDSDTRSGDDDVTDEREVAVEPIPSVAAGKLGEVLTMYRDLCDALRHIHAQGLVHRDVKPSNVFLTVGGGPVLMDFGLVSRAAGGIGREALSSEVSGRMLGTAPYVAPEQIRGEVVDARADLYSLGCMLYESLVGVAPFEGPMIRQVLLAHLNDEPVPPSLLVTGVPPALERLVLALLAKAPYDRIGHAEEVDAALADLGAPSGTPRSAEEAESQAYLYRPRLAGRKHVLDALDQRCERAAGGDGSLVLIGGESGIGKTSLLTELTQRALGRRFVVVTGECIPVGHAGESASERGGAPFQPFRRLLQHVGDRCREGGPAASLHLLGPGAALLAQYEPSLASLPNEIGASPPPRLTPEAAKQRMLATLARTVAALAEEQALLWVIDDLQWADELSLAFLASLSRAFFEHKKLLVVGTYRSDEVSAGLQSLLTGEVVAHEKLDRLDAHAVTSMVRDMLAMPSPPVSLVDLLARHSEGNPFFVAEYLRVAVSEKLFNRRQGAWNVSDDIANSFDRIPLSSSIKELMARHLGELDERSRALAQAASVLGREFEIDLLDPFWAADENRFEALAILQRRQVLEPSELGKLRFVHDKLREFTYASIGSDSRRLLHQKAALVLELRGTWSPEQFAQYPALAAHWTEAGNLRKGAEYFLRAASRSLESYANGDAIRFYEHAIDNLQEYLAANAEDGAARHNLLTAYEGVADILTTTGAHDKGGEKYRMALAQLASRDSIVRARLTRKLGKTHSAKNRHAEALAVYQLAEAMIKEELERESTSDPASSWREWVEVQNERVWAHYWLGNSDELERLVASLRPIVEHYGTASQRAQYYQALCLSELRRERYRVSHNSLELIRAASDSAERSVVSLESASVRFIFAFALLLAGKGDSALAELERVLHTADRHGDVLLRVRGLTYLGVAHRQRGELDTALDIARQTIGLAAVHSMPHYLGAGHANVGWALYVTSRFAEAEGALSEALRAWRSAPTVYPFQGLALWPLAASLASMARYNEVRPHLRALVDPSQQRLPDDLEAALRALIDRPSADSDPEPDSGAGMNQLFVLARGHHLL